jgi:D-amino-acid dehydrogenase
VKVAVIGAGVLGASTAYHLARDGAEVVVIDPARQGRATAAGAGIICAWVSGVTDPVYNEAALAAAQYYPNLIVALAELGQTDTSYRRVGALSVPNDPGELDRLEPIVRSRAAAAPGAGAISRLIAAEAKELFPPLRDGQPALHVAGGARVDGRKLTAALLAAARQHGAVVHEAEAALIVVGDSVRGVRVNGEEVGADAVVVAAGAWADPILAPLGLALGVQPQRGQIVHLHLPGAPTWNWPVLLPMNSYYLLAFDDERVVIGATRETGSGFDYRITAGGLAEVLNAGLAVAPGLITAAMIETRIGFRPAGPGIRPMLGRVAGIDGLLIGSGLGAGGLTLGPYAGAQLAAATLGLPTELDLAPFGCVASSGAGETST